MDALFLKSLYARNKNCDRCPSPKQIAEFTRGIIRFLFPDFDKKEFNTLREFQLYADQLKVDLEQILTSNSGEQSQAQIITESFFDALPDLSELIGEDITAMYMGDPAARSESEIIRSYPGFFAIASYRIAHVLKNLGVQLIPRLITEQAHSRTGIDIHPGATIGRSFCIDHGTGVVIGETSHIGKHVKIYQGVTLGGLSVDKADADTKRHPTIGDHVVIYAGATILGGQTEIGHHAVIGGNVWLTRSVPPHTKVYYKAALTNGDGDTDLIEYKL